MYLRIVYDILISAFMQSYRTVFSIVIVIIFSKLNLQRETAEEDVAIVLGNGPSLSSDIDKIVEFFGGKSCAFWCVNSFFESSYFERVRPKHYVLVDHAYWDNTSDWAQQLCQDTAKGLNDRTKWKMCLHIPFEARHSPLIRGIQNRYVTISFFNRTPIDGFRWFRHLLFDVNLGIPYAFNVVNTALFLAIRSGTRSIYVAGADHSWHESLIVDKNNNLLVTQEHFFDGQQAAPQPVFKSRAHDAFSIGELFIRWGNVFLGYRVVKEYADRKKASILNIGSKTYIDALPRRHLSELGNE